MPVVEGDNKAAKEEEGKAEVMEQADHVEEEKADKQIYNEPNESAVKDDNIKTEDNDLNSKNQDSSA